MTLLENTYWQLKDAELVNCAEAFSIKYLGKNKNWYAFQTHRERDFSADAAVQCNAPFVPTRRLLAWMGGSRWR